jgi:hypothetical protein
MFALWLLSAAGAGQAEELFAPTRTVEGRNFVLAGAGAMKSDAGRDYDLALYVDELDARRAFPALAARAGGKTRARLLNGEHAQSFVVWGHFSKLAVFHFARALEADAWKVPIKDALDEELGDKASPELKKQAEALIALFDHDVQEGQELYLRTDGDGHIEIELAGLKKQAPQSPKLARALWSVWLGGKPISKELQRALVDKVDLLGR